jgi:drug/metabolite transporter (DMT)-like permease
LLVVLGALILNSDSSRSWWRSITHERGAPLMIAVAFLWALSTALDKRALPHAAPASHAFLLCAGSAAILMSWILGGGRQEELGRVLGAPKALLGAMIGLAVAALALQMMALQWLWVAMLETLKRAFGVLGSVAFGRFVFFEPIDRRKQVAALLMVAGTTLLAVS